MTQDTNCDANVFILRFFYTENMAVNSTYSVYKSSKLPPREQKALGISPGIILSAYIFVMLNFW